MADAHRQTLGRWGEDTAAAYLIKQGCQIRSRNYHTPYGEIDIIAADGDELVFVEVKTRSSMQFGSPQEAVGYRKQQHLRLSAEYYLMEHPTDETTGLRFDVIAIVKRKGYAARLEHIRNAF